jgi:hypothetical protein
MKLSVFCRPVRLAYQPPASITFLSQQTSHQQPASSTLLSEQTSTSHQPPANRTGCVFAVGGRWTAHCHEEPAHHSLPQSGSVRGLIKSSECTTTSRTF